MILIPAWHHLVREVQRLKELREASVAAAAVIGMTKMTEQNVLTLHGGDVFIGDLFFTNSLESLNFN